MEPLVLGLRVLLALACVIGLIWVLARRAGWGKGRRRPAGPAVEVIGRHAFGRHAGVAVVAVGDRRLLLGYGEQNVTMLTELDPADPAESEALAAEEAAAPAPAPLTLGALAAAVLPRQRGARPAAAPVPSPRAVAFETALAGARAESAGAPAPGAGTVLDDVSSGDLPSPGAVTTTATTAVASEVSDVSGLAGLEVADVDPAHLPGLAHVAGEPAEVRPGALHGSVLAPSTWKQAVAALRERTVRR